MLHDQVPYISSLLALILSAISKATPRLDKIILIIKLFFI